MSTSLYRNTRYGVTVLRCPSRPVSAYAAMDGFGLHGLLHGFVWLQLLRNRCNTPYNTLSLERECYTGPQPSVIRGVIRGVTGLILDS